MHRFTYADPTTLDEACRLLREGEGTAKVMAGGCALLILVRNGLLAPETVVDIKRIPGLKGITHTPGRGIRIGTLTTHREIELSPVLQEHRPVLVEMARTLASVQVRNRGTIGGNLAHAEPAADPPTVLVALGATVEVHGPEGARQAPLDQFLVGYYETGLAFDEILTAVHVPDSPPHTGAAYIKFSTRGMGDMCLLGACARVTVDPHDHTCAQISVVLGNCDSRPVRVAATEQALLRQRLTPALVRQAAELADQGLNPVSDVRGSADYRRAMARIIVARAVLQAAERAGRSLA